MTRMFSSMDAKLIHVSPAKFLGITIDTTLTWKPHIDVCKVYSRNVGILNKVKYFLPKKKKKIFLYKLYSTLIIPYLTYGILLWGNP